jgi:hypothetical protein
MENENKDVNINYKYNAFYDLEIEKSNNDENYINLVKAIFGENSLCKPLENVLKLKQQITFDQFKIIYMFS